MSAIKNTSHTVGFNDRRLIIDGQPKLVLAGEIHYFRLSPNTWSDRLQRLQDNGLDTVATYIPWLWHELADGSFDLIGRTHPQRDLVSFLDLCAARGLFVIARPGPFVMAELKNEGIPYRMYRNYPAIKPVTWDGAAVPSRTLDYLAPQFLSAVRSWYSAVMPELAKRLAGRGGPILGVQLDNEIGMLSWVTNSPDLTDLVCEDMRAWSRERYGDDLASKRIGADPLDATAWAAALRSPGADSLPLHQDLALYMRDRFRRYVETLRRYAQEDGIRDVPLLINVHGTSDGRGRTFPIGISQLFEAYSGQAGMTSGSDIYLGDLTVGNVADLYVINAFMAAVHDRDQPTMSLEFEAGNGDYGQNLGLLYTPEAIELKTRLCLAQGNRLLNYYLHAGGENPPFESAGDGIDRLAFTGQEHGFAAPVGPTGKENATYPAITKVVSAMRAVGDLLADSHEEHDNFALGFVPDHYLTEYRYPGSPARAEQIADLERFRGLGGGDSLARALVLGGFSFPAVNLQAGVPQMPAVALATGRTLGRAVQQHLVAYVRGGGKLLLAGLLPDQDHDGAPCTILADALGLKSAGRVWDKVSAEGTYHPVAAGHNFAVARPQVAVSSAQLLAQTDRRDMTLLLTEMGSGLPCAVKVRCGDGEAIVLGCDYPAYPDFYKGLLALLEVVPRWQLDVDSPGALVTSTVSSKGQRLLHLLNVAPSAVSLSLSYRRQTIFGGHRLEMPARSGMVLPYGVQCGIGRIVESTAEIVDLGDHSIALRPTQDKDVIVLETPGSVRSTKGKVRRNGNRVEIVIRRSQHRNKPVRLDLI
jgi:beta-galactosidase